MLPPLQGDGIETQSGQALIGGGTLRHKLSGDVAITRALPEDPDLPWTPKP